MSRIKEFKFTVYVINCIMLDSGKGEGIAVERSKMRQKGCASFVFHPFPPYHSFPLPLARHAFSIPPVTGPPAHH